MPPTAAAPAGGSSDGQVLSPNGNSSGSGSGSSHSQPSARRLSISRTDSLICDQKDGHQDLRRSSSPPPESPRVHRNPLPARSRFTKFFRWLFSPFANFFITIYNLFFRRIPKPKPILDEDREEKMENRGTATNNIDDRQTKENVNPRLNHAAANLTLRDAAAPIFPPIKPVVPLVPVVPAGAPLKSVEIREEEDEDPARKAERAIHQGFIEEALDMARLALKTNETPVGCVLVYRGRVIAKGMNATNITRNGTRHAEYMALSSLFGTKPDAPPLSHPSCKHEVDDPGEWDAVDVTKSYLYPYGQKLHPSPHVTASVVQESTLYVTVEPCVMCASLLRQLGIKKVYFGAVNDKFGGTGGVFRIHMNSTSVKDTPSQPTRRVMAGRILRVHRDGTKTNLDADGDEPAHPAQQRPESSVGQQQHLQPISSSVSSTGIMTPPSSVPSPGPARAMYQMGEYAQANQKWEINPKPPADPPQGSSRYHDGDGGNVEKGYEAEGGWGRDDAVTLLRQFYVQENGRAPVPRKKEGRAARLAAMMEKDGINPSIDLKVVTNMPASAPATVAGTPVAEEDEDTAGMDIDGDGDAMEVSTPMSEVA